MRVRTDDDARGAARAFRERAGCGAVLMTRGDQGMWLLASDAEGSLPASAREVADVTGAGDTVIATMALALAAGATLAEAARLANEAAGIAVAKFGPAVVTPAELLRAFDASAAELAACGAGCLAERAGLRAGGLPSRRRLGCHASRWVAETGARSRDTRRRRPHKKRPT